MKHCYVDCTVISDDDYRTRYDCKVCKRTFFQLKDRTVGSSTSERSSSTLILKNGSPFITCGWCTQEEKLHWSKTIRVLIRWERNGQQYDRIPMEHNPWIGHLPGDRIVVPAYRPVINQVQGCRECYNEQSSETAKLGRPHYFGADLSPKVDKPTEGKSTTIYKPKPDVIVVQSGVFPSSEHASVQKGWNTTPDSEDVNIREGLYGPYHDRKGNR